MVHRAFENNQSLSSWLTGTDFYTRNTWAPACSGHAAMRKSASKVLFRRASGKISHAKGALSAGRGRAPGRSCKAQALVNCKMPDAWRLTTGPRTKAGRVSQHHRSPQRKPQALQMDQIRRRNPRIRKTLLPEPSQYYAANSRFT